MPVKRRPPAARLSVRSTDVAAFQGLVVTIDGPAGSGKSTAAQLLAKTLGLQYLDTGATYRTLAYASGQARINIADVQQLIELARRLPIHLSQTREGELRVDLGGRDVTRAIRTEEVSEAAAHGIAPTATPSIKNVVWPDWATAAR